MFVSKYITYEKFDFSSEFLGLLIPINFTDALISSMDYGHKMAKSLILCGPSSNPNQRYTYTVLQTIQMKLILLWVWAERAVLGRAKTALKLKYEI